VNIPANVSLTAAALDYDSHSGLETRETDLQKRGDVRLIELKLCRRCGDRVPATC